MKRKKTSRFNSFVMIMLIISFLFGFCGVGQLFGEKNEIPQTEEVSTLTDNPTIVIPEKEPVIDSGNYTVKTWDDYIVEKYARGEEIEFEGSGTETDPYKISTAEQLAFVSYLSNNGYWYPCSTKRLEEMPIYSLAEGENSILPANYIRLEYLESNGYQYIDTGVFAKTTGITKYEAEIQYKTTGTRQIMGYDYPGAFEVNAQGKYPIFNVPCSTDSFDHLSFEWDYENKTTRSELNGVVKTGTIASMNSTRGNIILFAVGNYNGYKCSCKIKSFKIYDETGLLRDFIPCYNQEKETSGMYDIVNGVFYQNPDGVDFFKKDNTYLSVQYKTIELTNDIYLNDGKLGLNETKDESGNVMYSPSYEDGGDRILYQWKPIWKEKSDHHMVISIIGNGYKIDGLYVNEITDKAGLIGHCGGGGNIGNLHLKNALVYSTANKVGGFSGTLERSVAFKNCSFDGYVIGKNYVAGFAGYQVNGGQSFPGSVNYGTIIAIENYASGFSHNSYPHSPTTRDSVNYGTIIAKNYAGGISSLGIIMVNCINYGEIIAKSGAAFGIGQNSSTNCVNYGELRGNYCYGISSLVATDCINYGKIIASNGAHGINVSGATNCINYANIICNGGASGISKSGSLKNCINYGRIEGKTSAAGIYTPYDGNDYSHTATIYNCVNYGDVISINGHAGGISQLVGRSLLYIHNCVNYGFVQGKIYAGGLTATTNSRGQMYIHDSINYGEVKCEADAGGLIGNSSGLILQIISCTNVGRVTSKTNTGGLVGSITGGSATIDSCTNEGKVSGKTATGFVGQATGSCTINNSLNNGDITSSTYKETILSSTFGVNKVSQLTNCITSSKINGEKVNACAYVKDGYFSEQYRTGKIISSNASHTAMFQGVIDADYIKENSFVDFTPPPEDSNKMYTKLEYIESDGNQYIDTGVVVEDGFLIEAQVSFTQFTGNYQTIIGSELNPAKTTRSIIGISPTNKWFCGVGGKVDEATQGVELNTIYNIKASTRTDNYYFDVENERKISGIEANTRANLSLYIFALNKPQHSNYLVSKCRIYGEFKIFDGDDLIRSFIPAKRNSDGVVGLYDKVEGKFYENQGSGDFDAGHKASQVPARYTELKSIKSNGSQYINSGVNFSPNLKIQTTYKLTKTTDNRNYIFGLVEKDSSRVQWSHSPESFAGFNKTYEKFGMTCESNKLYTMTMDKGIFKLNDNVISNQSGQATGSISDKTVTIFGCYTDGQVTNYSNIKMYSFLIWDDGVLIRNFIPAKRNSDGMVGLYDTVEGKFYTDANGGNFEVGD